MSDNKKYNFNFADLSESQKNAIIFHEAMHEMYSLHYTKRTKRLFNCCSREHYDVAMDVINNTEINNYNLPNKISASVQDDIEDFQKQLKKALGLPSDPVVQPSKKNWYKFVENLKNEELNFTVLKSKQSAKQLDKSVEIPCKVCKTKLWKNEPNCYSCGAIDPTNKG